MNIIQTGVRYRYLDGLRGGAALVVAFHHSITAFDFALYSGNPADAHGRWELPVSNFPFFIFGPGGNTAVCLFFVLSGYVLTHSFIRSSASVPALIAKRAIRLGLPILCACIFSWALLSAHLIFNHQAATISHSSWLTVTLTRSPVFLDALREGTYGALVGPWSGATSYDSALWTMPIEFAASIMLIVLASVAKVFKLVDKWQVYVIAGLAALSIVLHAYYLSLFTAGAIIYMLDLPRCTAPMKYRIAVVAVLLVVGSILATVPFSAVRGPWWQVLISIAPSRPLLTLPLEHPGLVAGLLDGTQFWHAVGAILILLVVEMWPTARQLLSKPICCFFGEISFPLYLFHIPVLLSVGCGILILLHKIGLPYVLCATLAGLAYLAVLIGVAAIASRTIERYAINLAALMSSWIDSLLRFRAVNSPQT